MERNLNKYSTNSPQADKTEANDFLAEMLFKNAVAAVRSEKTRF
jgi:hypothetical protein